jgi:hypothetical protein
MRLSILLSRWAVAGAALTAGMAAADTDSRFSDAEFEIAGVLPMASEAGDIKTAYLWVYRSALGSQLGQRALTQDELAELRRLCTAMEAKGAEARPQGFDGYGIEFADGKGNTARLSPGRRAVFFFWGARGGCDAAPSRGAIE